jgi:DNA polymerase-3 subunit epsilon
MSLILGLDFETTGLNPLVHSITEVGMVLWETSLRTPIKVMGFMVDPGPSAVWDPEVIGITGITPESCSQFGYESERGLKQVLSWYQTADMACAHNGGPFDHPFLINWAAKFGYEVEEKLWIDTNTDLNLPEKVSRKLTYMAADHNFLNPFPHRAVFDVMTMLKVLDQHNLEEVIFLAKQPNIVVQALVSFDEKDLAKARGYHAEYDNGKFKGWIRTMKACFLEKEKDEAGFPMAVLPPS